MARKQWRCFHCDEVFISFRCAREHFGADEGALTGCQIKSHEGHILVALRRAEDDLARLRAEDSDLMRAIYSLEADKARAVREAEERGYAKGVADMQAQGHCPEPAAHSIKSAAA
jgi:hypothetical protein